jgi:hypothetical protein
MSTVHANSPIEAVSRLETLVLMSGTDLPSRAIREQIASAVHLVVQQQRLRGGGRRIVSVSEVIGFHEASGSVELQELFALNRRLARGQGDRLPHRHRPAAHAPGALPEERRRAAQLALRPDRATRPDGALLSKAAPCLLKALRLEPKRSHSRLALARSKEQIRALAR